MTDKTSVSKKGYSTDWFMRGVLARIGDTFDRLTGRRWVPSSSLATSELIERIKNLLDTEAKQIPGKGIVVPHNIKLKMQWDKFSADAEKALTKLEHELMAAAADHINDSLYYTLAPLQLQIKPDYFTEGVKLYVSFDQFSEAERDVELNVTVPAINIGEVDRGTDSFTASDCATFVAKFHCKGVPIEKRLNFPLGQSLSVGRTGGNDLVLDDISVSKIHAALAVNGEGHLSVADTGSTNGTFINDQRIAYGKATPLLEGDRVKFGGIEVAFEHVPDPIVNAVQDENKELTNVETIEIEELGLERRISPESQPKITSGISINDETLEIDPTPGKNEINQATSNKDGDDDRAGNRENETA